MTNEQMDLFGEHPERKPKRRSKREEIEAGWRRALSGTALASLRWSDEQSAAVLEAIRTTALRYGEFTTDEVWEVLGPEFPVTKGMTGKLNRAKNLGWIRSTGTTRLATREGEHNHAQRLVVWESLIWE